MSPAGPLLKAKNWGKRAIKDFCILAQIGHLSHIKLERSFVVLSFSTILQNELIIHWDENCNHHQNGVWPPEATLQNSSSTTFYFELWSKIMAFLEEAKVSFAARTLNFPYLFLSHELLWPAGPFVIISFQVQQRKALGSIITWLSTITRHASFFSCRYIVKYRLFFQRILQNIRDNKFLGESVNKKRLGKFLICSKFFILCVSIFLLWCQLFLILGIVWISQ